MVPTRPRSMDRAVPRRTYDWNAFPDRFDLSQQGKAGGSCGGACAAVPNLGGLAESFQHPRASRAYDLSHRDQNRRPARDRTLEEVDLRERSLVPTFTVRQRFPTPAVSPCVSGFAGDSGLRRVCWGSALMRAIDARWIPPLAPFAPKQFVRLRRPPSARSVIGKIARRQSLPHIENRLHDGPGGLYHIRTLE